MRVISCGGVAASLCGVQVCHSGKVIYLPFPQRLGWREAVAWCDQGVTGGLQNTVVQLFQSELHLADAQKLRELYFAGTRPQSHTTNSRSDNGYNAVNNLLAVTRVIPLFKDMLDLPQNAKVGDKLSDFFEKVCTLFDAEAQVPRLVEDGSPFSCAMMDAVHSGVACGADILEETESCDNLSTSKSDFPQATCFPAPRTLQALDVDHLAPFRWHDPNVSFPLTLKKLVGLEQIRYEEEPSTSAELFRKVESEEPHFERRRLPALIPNKVRDSELLTYLALYRSLRKMYSINDRISRCGHDEEIDNVQLIPGWNTTAVIGFVQAPRTAFAKTNHTNPSGENQITFASLFASRPPMMLPNLQDWPYLQASLFWDTLDHETHKAARNAIRDFRALFSDPVNVYKALADILENVATPYIRERAPATTPFFSPKKLLGLAASFARATRPKSMAKTNTTTNPKPFPMLFVSKRNDHPCQIAIGLRGTKTFSDWLADFYQWAAPDHYGGESHRGVQAIVDSILPTLTLILQDHTAEHNCTCAETTIIFYGHSLGAAIAQQLSLRLTLALRGGPDREDGRAASGCEVRVDAVLFAPLRQLSDKARHKFDELINGRILIDVSDPLSYLPCPKNRRNSGHPRCGTGHMISSGSGRDSYAEHSGIVWLDVDFGALHGGSSATPAPPETQRNQSLLSLIASTLLPPSTQRNLPSASEILAAHTCAHSCALSAACTGSPESAFRWWCEDCPDIIFQP